MRANCECLPSLIVKRTCACYDTSEESEPQMACKTLHRALNHGRLLQQPQPDVLQQPQPDDDVEMEEATASVAAADPASKPSILEKLLQLDEDVVDGLTLDRLTTMFEDILDAEGKAPMSFWVSHRSFQQLMRQNAKNFKLLPLMTIAAEAREQREVHDMLRVSRPPARSSKARPSRSRSRSSKARSSKGRSTSRV